MEGFIWSNQAKESVSMRRSWVQLSLAMRIHRVLFWKVRAEVALLLAARCLWSVRNKTIGDGTGLTDFDAAAHRWRLWGESYIWTAGILYSCVRACVRVCVCVRVHHSHLLLLLLAQSATVLLVGIKLRSGMTDDRWSGGEWWTKPPLFCLFRYFPLMASITVRWALRQCDPTLLYRHVILLLVFEKKQNKTTKPVILCNWAHLKLSDQW